MGNYIIIIREGELNSDKSEVKRINKGAGLKLTCPRSPESGGGSPGGWQFTIFFIIINLSLAYNLYYSVTLLSFSSVSLDFDFGESCSSLGHAIKKSF